MTDGAHKVTDAEFTTGVTTPVAVPTPADMKQLGQRLATQLRAGDILLLSGGLGAGKTTLTTGIGEGLGVRGAVTSPTFVIARVHPPARGDLALVHVDAYRLSGWDELLDLDLSASFEESVTVIEWGEGLAEGLAPDRLEVRISTSDNVADLLSEDFTDRQPRHVSLVGVGARWRNTNLTQLLIGA